jgi:hypothetical protein
LRSTSASAADWPTISIARSSPNRATDASRMRSAEAQNQRLMAAKSPARAWLSTWSMQ